MGDLTLIADSNGSCWSLLIETPWILSGNPTVYSDNYWYRTLSETASRQKEILYNIPSTQNIMIRNHLSDVIPSDSIKYQNWSEQRCTKKAINNQTQ